MNGEDRLMIVIRDLHLQPGHTVDESVSVENLVEMIKSQKSTHRTFVVMKGTRPIGIVRSNDMFRILGTHYGVALHYKKKMRDVMYENILTVDWSESIIEVSRKAMARSYEDIYDDVVVTHNGEFLGVIPIYELLNYMTQWKVREATQKNPLSGLPGNDRILEELTHKKEQGEPFSVIYIDMDNFKAYNDVYGFKYGDDMLKWTSEILQQCNLPNLFVGHIGGDDFVVIIAPDHAEFYCQKIIELFDQGKVQFYTEEDRSKTYILSLDRQHQIHKFPLVSLSIAIVDIYSTASLTIPKISALVAQVKKHTKQVQGSVYHRILFESC